MPIPGWLKEGAKWGAGTIGGILVTLAITSYADRARPSAEVAQIKISASDNDLAKASLKRIVSVPLASEDLFSELAQSAWTEAFRDPSDVLEKVISKLGRNREYVEGYLRHAQSYLQLKKEMTLLLNGEKSPKAAENFFDDWQQVDGFIYGSIRSQMRYGSAALQTLKCEQDPAESHLRKLTYHNDPVAQYFGGLVSGITTALQPHREALDGGQLRIDTHSQRGSTFGTSDGSPGDEHIYSVTKIGGRYKTRFDVASNLDENEIVTKREEQCAENVMAALADFDKEKLNAILDLTDLEAKSVELHKKIQSELDKYIKGYSFWSVSMLLSNKGKGVISFSPNATLYVNMSGTPINGGNDLAISLRASNRNGESDTVTIPGGESRLVNFISSDLVKDYEDWQKVIDLFEQSARNCVVVLHPQTGDWQQGELIFSPITIFGPPAKASPTEARVVSARFRQ
jgi:hypothetical protein